MKISDLPRGRTDEGLTDWLGSTGILGTTAKGKAMSKQQQAQAYKIGLSDFTNKINSALSSAVSSGIVQTPQQGASAAPAQPGTNYDTPTAQRQGINPEQNGAQTGQAQQGQQTNGPPLNIPVPPNQRLELIGKKDKQLSYYKTQAGWFNANNQKLQDKDAQGLEKSAASKGGSDYTLRRMPVANVQVNNKTKGNKKNRRQNESYQQLNWLLENSILREQDEETVSSFIENFVSGQTSKFPQNPAYIKRVKDLAKAAEADYAKSKSVNKEISKKLWDLIWAWSQLGGSGGSQQGQSNQNQGQEQDTSHYDKIQRELDTTAKFLKVAANDPNKLASPGAKPFFDLMADWAKKYGGRA